MNPMVDSAFRIATPTDVPAIVALVESAYRGQSSRTGWTTEADLLDGQRIDPEGVVEVIKRADSMVLLFEGGAGLLACVHLEKRGGTGYFGMFAVSPQAQAQGIGRQVLDEVERWARSRWRCEYMTMMVIVQRDDLIRWYERRGYRRTGRYEPFPYGDERFGRPRRDDLRFERLEKMLQIDEEARP